MTSFLGPTIPLDLDRPLWLNKQGVSKFEWGAAHTTTQTKIQIRNLSMGLRDLINLYIDPTFLQSIGIDSFASDDIIYYDLTEIEASEWQIKELTDLYNRIVSEQKWILNSIRWQVWIQSIQMLYKRLLEKHNTVCILWNGFASEKTIKLYIETKWWKRALEELGFKLPLNENKEYNILTNLLALETNKIDKENKIFFAIYDILKNNHIRNKKIQEIQKKRNNKNLISDASLSRIILGELLSQ